MLFRFIPSDNELARSQSAGFASVTDMRFSAWLNLVWVVFVPMTPVFAEGAFPNWLPGRPGINLAIFPRAVLPHVPSARARESARLWYALAIAALGFISSHRTIPAVRPT